MTSASRLEPPGWMIAATPAAVAAVPVGMDDHARGGSAPVDADARAADVVVVAVAVDHDRRRHVVGAVPVAKVAVVPVAVNGDRGVRRHVAVPAPAPAGREHANHGKYDDQDARIHDKVLRRPVHST